MKVDQRSLGERPIDVSDSTGNPVWGSDVVVDLLRRLDIEFAALLPGASFRGIHDSLVNYGANMRPQLLLCVHEAVAVAVARGYARVTGRPMAAILHNVVGLLNAAMTIYDAWVDRVPVLVLGGGGPMDAPLRRPWIDWMHTAMLQGDLVRGFTKWDDQPASINAIPEALLRGYRIAVTEPQGPVYICFDKALQEQPITQPFHLPDVSRYRPAVAPEPDRAAISEAADLLLQAELPIAFGDAVGREPHAVRVLVDLAELLAMPVLDIGRWWRNFPSPHPLDFTGMHTEITPEADVVLGLDMLDFDSALRVGAQTGRRVINISQDELLHRALFADYQALPAVDLPVLASGRRALPLLLEECRRRMDEAAQVRIAARGRALAKRQDELRRRRASVLAEQWNHRPMTEARLGAEVWDAVKDTDFVLTAGAPEVIDGAWQIPGPERDVSGVASGSLGAETAMTLGAALALKGTGKLPVGIVGDGAYLMFPQTLWTAVHYRIPALWIVANNRSYFNDEMHQDTVARMRGRPIKNRWIAQRMEEPAVDFAALARPFGAEGFGPVEDPEELARVLRRAVEVVRAGGAAVVDVHVADRASI